MLLWLKFEETFRAMWTPRVAGSDPQRPSHTGWSHHHTVYHHTWLDCYEHVA